MSTLSPELIAEVLERQGEISKEQATQLRHEARMLPKPGQRAAYEQRSAAYDLVNRLAFSSQRRPGTVVDEDVIAQAVAHDSGLPHVHIDPLKLNADLIESEVSRPFARRHRMVPLDMTNGKLRLQYEVNPMAFVFRAAGGAATTGSPARKRCTSWASALAVW